MKRETQKKNNTFPKDKIYRTLKKIGKVFLYILLVFAVLVLFIRSPFAQNLIKNKLVTYISNKTNTKVVVDKLFITFSGNVQVEGLYLEDKQQDTLLYSKSLEANIALWPIVTGKGVGVNAVDWDGFRANISRKDTISGFNFEFLMDAFITPDTTTTVNQQPTEPLQITLGRFNLNNFNVVYNDAVTGINSHFIFKQLIADIKTTSLETMEFRAQEMVLTDANINFTQHPVPQVDAESSPLPILSSEVIQLNNVKANYQSLAEDIALDVSIKNLYTEIPNAELSNNLFNITALQLDTSSITFTTHINNNAVEQQKETNVGELENDSEIFEWPDVTFDIKDVSVKNSSFGYFVGNAKITKNKFNPNAVLLNNINLYADAIAIKEKEASINIQSAYFKEYSGYQLKNFSTTAMLTNKAIDVSQLLVKLNQSDVQGQFYLKYPSLSSLFNSPEHSKINIDFPAIKINTNDIIRLQPKLNQNQYFNTLSKNNFTGSIKGSGTLSNINLEALDILYGNTTKLYINGHIQNVTKPDALQYDITKISFHTTSKDITPFLSQNKSITIPENIDLNGFIKGNALSIETGLNLKTTQGNAVLRGKFKSAEQLVFNTTLNVNNYQIHKLLNNPNLGVLTATVDANGKGKTINELDADFNATVNTFNLNNYAINNLKIDGSFTDGKGKITSNYKDDNLNANVLSTIVLDSVMPKASIDLNVIGANLQALGVLSRDIKTGFKLHTNFVGNATKYNVNANLKQGVVVYDDKSYLTGNVNIDARVREDTTAVSIQNKLIDFDLQSNADPETFSKALSRHIASYFYRDTKILDSIINPVNLKIRAHIAQAPILSDVFLVNIKDLDTIDITMDFNEKNKKFTAKATAPHINYSGNEIDSLAFSINTHTDEFNFNLGFNKIIAGPLQIPKSVIKGEQLNNSLSLDFLAFHEDEDLMNIKAEITGDRDRLRFHVIPENLVLNKSNWTIPENNEIIITDTQLEFNQFQINKGNQSIALTDKLPAVKKQHIAINYKNFQVHEVLDYLNPNTHLASGILSGDFILEEPFAQTGFVADLDIEKFNLLEVDMGRLNLTGKSAGGNRYNMEIYVKDGAADLDITGNYTTRNESANIDLNFDINTFKMKALTKFSQGEIEEARGYFSGNFKLNGTTDNPQYKGNITFNNAQFRIAKLNSGFTLKNEMLALDNDGLSMKNFTIIDEKDNTLVVSGEVGTTSILNPTFNLNIKAKNFQMLNASPDDNDFLYGKAVVDADVKVSGDLQIPKINMKASINPQTNVTYVMPSATANIEERDGVVVFVNRKNKDAILTQTENQKTVISGFDITTLWNIKKGASATVVIDKQTGDNFKISGNGTFNFDMKPNGRMNLSGVYNISNGHYEMNLYNLVNRRFDIAKGSKVSWFGDPFDAKLDVKAVYNVETSSTSLMAPTFSSIGATQKGRYRQVLPFLVYLNLDGELMTPKISFKLDMPEDEQGAIGGQIYGRIQQINQQESELNKQVFSLLVLNRFYPDSGSDGSSGGIASVARDNLNDALSDQLNIFSDKIFGKTGFDIDFGLDSYTDYQGNTPQDRTQLDIAAQKKLFDDRLIVRVGSEVDLQGSSATRQTTPLVGNVSLEYLLTNNGRYRLKGFRRNEFENVIDGQTIATGLALIFTQEFNKFKELWDAMFSSKEEEIEESERVEPVEKKIDNVSKNLKKEKN